jgi:osmoprotectant transport system permease protein
MADARAGASARALDQSAIGVTGALLGALVTVFGDFVWLRPNRVLDGDAQTALQALGLPGWLLLAAWLAMGMLAFAGGRALGDASGARGWSPSLHRAAALARGALANLTLLALVALAALRASAYAAAEGNLARTSLGLAFWLGVLAAYLVIASADKPLGTSRMRPVIRWTSLVGVVALLLTGTLDSLSLLREYAITQDAFWLAFRQHLLYTLGATGVAVAISVPLGVWSARKHAVEAAVFGVLNVAQVMPALAFVGLLIPILGNIGRSIPIAGALGISGIGWAPAFIVLVLYAAFPVARNTLTAMRTLDAGVLDAAKGVGMGARHRLFQVELPLAFPVVLAGIRIALVQTAAGSIVAALVGGGGLGRIVFFGLEQAASDLVLLGVIPIVGLGLTLDLSLRWAERKIRREDISARLHAEGAAA